ncbi:unnamed protein product [Lampetra planeri]
MLRKHTTTMLGPNSVRQRARYLLPGCGLRWASVKGDAAAAWSLVARLPGVGGSRSMPRGSERRDGVRVN